MVGRQNVARRFSLTDGSGRGSGRAPWLWLDSELASRYVDQTRCMLQVLLYTMLHSSRDRAGQDRGKGNTPPLR